MKYFSNSKNLRIDTNQLELEDSFKQEYANSKEVFQFLTKNLQSNNPNKMKFCISKLNEYVSDELPGIAVESWLVEFLINILFDENDEDVKVNKFIKLVREFLDNTELII
jgi:hypothetical protein